VKSTKLPEAVIADFQRDIYCILGMPIDSADTKQTVEIIESSAKNNQRCFLSTVNLNFFVQSLKQDDFHNSLVQSDLSVADGQPILWLAKCLGVPLRERVAGSTLFEQLQTRQNAQEISVFFFGGQDNVAEKAMLKMNTKSNGLTCVGALNPGIGSIEEMSTPKILESINSVTTDFVVVSLGAKKGQAWIMENISKLNAPVVSHLGAVVNFVEGSVARAPTFIQNSGLEWAWRIKEEPVLWKRYFFDGIQLIRILLSRVIPYAYYDKKLRGKLSSSNYFDFQVNHAEDGLSVLWKGSATKETLKSHRDSLAEVAATTKNRISLDLTDVEYIDQSTLGLITLLEKHLGSRFKISCASEAAAKILRYNQMERLIIFG